jgi:uncharacterized protein
MTLEEIMEALKAPGAPAADALRDAVKMADELAPAVFALVDKACEGIFLLPEDGRLLTNGLTVLAAAKHGGLWAYLLKLGRLPEDELEQFFEYRTSINFTRMLLSVWDGDSDAVFSAIEDEELAYEVRTAWFDVLARLTFDGAIPRERTFEFLTRLERDGAFAEDDMIWWGWELAVTRLGATELEPALKRVRSKAIFEHFNEADQEESFEMLRRAAADPGDPAVFDEDEVCAIGDPVEAYAWIERREKVMEKWDAREGVEEAEEPDDDPAASVRLTGDEIEWLSGFLESRQAPDTAMPFDMFDGFLTALVIGPGMVMPSAYMPVVWGTKDGEGPIWDGVEQFQYFMGLTQRHWSAIAARRNADAPHDPQTGFFGGEDTARVWAHGFARGMELGGDAWKQLFHDESISPAGMQILALALAEDELSDEDREAIAEDLPEIVREIAAYWRDAPALPIPQLPDRVEKIGRNEPCPCGSGKKYKKCCMNKPPVFH